MVVGKQIKRIKEERDLKLKQISSSTGLSVSYLSDIINERTLPSLPSLQKISQGFEVSMASLLGEEGVPYRSQAETELMAALQDFPSWPEQDQADLLRYIQEKTRLRKK